MSKRLGLAVTVVLAFGLASAGCADPQSSVSQGMVTFLNPEGLHRNPAFSQAVVISGPARTVYVGGQNAVDAAGNIIGKGDIGLQAEQVAKNIETALAAGQAAPEQVIKWTVYVVEGQSAGPAYAAFRKVWGTPAHPPLLSVVFVSALAHPDFLLEVEAVAVVPE